MMTMDQAVLSAQILLLICNLHCYWQSPQFFLFLYGMPQRSAISYKRVVGFELWQVLPLLVEPVDPAALEQLLWTLPQLLGPWQRHRTCVHPRQWRLLGQGQRRPALFPMRQWLQVCILHMQHCLKMIVACHRCAVACRQATVA